jgi:hypothetical protein
MECLEITKWKGNFEWYRRRKNFVIAEAEADFFDVIV